MTVATSTVTSASTLFITAPSSSTKMKNTAKVTTTETSRDTTACTSEASSTTTTTTSTTTAPTLLTKLTKMVEKTKRQVRQSGNNQETTTASINLTTTTSRIASTDHPGNSAVKHALTLFYENIVNYLVAFNVNFFTTQIYRPITDKHHIR